MTFDTLDRQTALGLCVVGDGDRDVPGAGMFRRSIRKIVGLDLYRAPFQFQLPRRFGVPDC